MILFSNKYVWIPLYIYLIYFLYTNEKKIFLKLIVISVLAVIISDFITSSLMKPYFERLRPCNNPELVGIIDIVSGCGKKYSFASSHSSTTFSLATIFYFITKKRIQLAEISLGDFEGRLENELLNWFSLTPQHWIMLHMVMLAYYKNKSITKNQLLKVIEKSYLTSNIYIDTAIKKGFFRIIRNEKDKRSIFILPSVITIKTFEGFIDRRDILYKGIK